MKKILVLTSKYLPNPSANGINTKYIVNELKKRGHDVTCISLKSDDELDFEIIDDTKIYRVTPSSYTKVLDLELQNKKSGKAIYYSIRHILRKVKLALLLPIFPNFDPKQSQKVYKRLEELHKLNTFDCVVGIFKPYANIAALKKFKKKYSNVICIGYYLDLLNSMQKPSIMPGCIYKILLNRENKSTLKIFDKNLIAISGKKMYSQIGDKELLSKIYYVDFPTFQQRDATMKQNEREDKSETIFTYAGTLSREYRNPELLLDILNIVSQRVGKLTIEIYGKNDCEHIFEKYNNNPNFQINNNGLASHETVLRKMQHSDFLINVSNILQDAVPSKIFELFSLGKPILNLVFDENDVTTDYFTKYPVVYNIKSWVNIDLQIEVIQDFISRNRGGTFKIEDIRTTYRMNTPEYTVDFIEEAIHSASIKE